MRVSATDTSEREGENRTARAWLAACLAVTAVSALLSNGAYHDDDLKHYLFARWTRHDIQFLTHVWGRPGFTLLYALPAQLGWWACRLLSVAVSGIAAWATFRAAGYLKLPRAAWSIPLIYALPLFLHLSTTTLTETPAAAYLALATWALLAGRERTAAAVFSLFLITRHEAIVLLPIWAWAICRDMPPGHSRILPAFRRHWPALALLLWAPLVHNAATWLAFGYLPGEVFSKPSGAIHYGQGTPLTFIMRFIVMAGPVAATLFVVGCRALWPTKRARPLIAGVIIYIAAQTILYMFQAYASGGYARFLVPVAPWVAITALAGANLVIDTKWRAPRSSGLAWFAVAVALWACVEIEQAVNPIIAISPYFWLFRLAAFGVVLSIAVGFIPRYGRRVCAVMIAMALLGPVARAAWPHRLRPRETVIADTVAVLRDRGLIDRPFYSTNDWSYGFANRWYPARHAPLYEQLRTATPGSLLVWERRYGPSPDFSLPLQTLRADPGWREILHSPADAAGLSFVHVFERKASTTRP